MFNSLEHKFQNNRARDRIHNEFEVPPRQGWLGLKKLAIILFSIQSTTANIELRA